MITFVFGIVLGLAAGLLIGANNTSKVKKVAKDLEAKLEELKARQ